MLIETNQKPISERTRKALLMDGDNDRYRRKEKTSLLHQAGFRVFPVLKIEHARARCKPGAFDLVAVIAGDNAQLATDFCDEVLRTNPQQQILLVAGSSQALPERNYIVPTWEDLMKKVGGAANNQANNTSQGENSLSAA